MDGPLDPMTGNESTLQDLHHTNPQDSPDPGSNGNGYRRYGLYESLGSLAGAVGGGLGMIAAFKIVGSTLAGTTLVHIDKLTVTPLLVMGVVSAFYVAKSVDALPNLDIFKSGTSLLLALYIQYKSRLLSMHRPASMLEAFPLIGGVFTGEEIGRKIGRAIDNRFRRLSSPKP